MTENLLEMSNIELVHKLRKESDNLSLNEGNEIVLILLERLILRDALDNLDPYEEIKMRK